MSEPFPPFSVSGAHKASALVDKLVAFYGPVSKWDTLYVWQFNGTTNSNERRAFKMADYDVEAGLTRSLKRLKNEGVDMVGFSVKMKPARKPAVRKRKPKAE